MRPTHIAVAKTATHLSLPTVPSGGFPHKAEQMLSRKRRRIDPPTIHPNNRYSENPPDFRLLSSLYPSFHPYVFASRGGRPAIDWTDFNATRELTRVLLHHDHGVEWWIPDGQLCPTVPNRLNYIHWIGDLLSSGVIPARVGVDGGKVRGFDIGTGANCIYPLLGASLYQWSFVGSDITEVALDWSRKNVESNPHLSELIEIRNANENSELGKGSPPSTDEIVTEEVAEPNDVQQVEEPREPHSNGHCYSGPPVLVNVVMDGEEFDFCMCNPPFFERIEEANLNPKTSCGGTHEEMVCPGGERAFLTQIIEDSIVLKHSFRWFTSMVGRKANLKILVSKLRDVGVSIVKTTEFVQGHTARWGLAWSFMPPSMKPVLSHAPDKSQLSFMLQGLQRQFSAIHVLKATETFFHDHGATCKTDTSSFFINVDFSANQIGSILDKDTHVDTVTGQSCNGSGSLHSSNDLCFRISVYEQIPGTILIKGSLKHKGSPFAGVFSSLLHNLEDALRKQFVKKCSG